MEVRWTRRARRRLDDYTDYIALRNPKAADEVLQRVRHDVDGLADNPLMGREGRFLGTRELVIAGLPYVVIYRVRGQRVEVITVHDTRQQWPESL
jgi:addiction module RelE/StbE family toxin